MNEKNLEDAIRRLELRREAKVGQKEGLSEQERKAAVDQLKFLEARYALTRGPGRLGDGDC